ncbi:MAG TPA: SpoIIE family protein phosphatase [Gemmataceae bacterium]|nr:SpoIIE family protein phosphatase [Gemmataceae bacterium]
MSTIDRRAGARVVPGPAGQAMSVAGTASILVVDDAQANLQVLAGMLKDRGYKARPVPSGKLALLAARKDPPDLILLDINMPEMNGYEVCQLLKADDNLKGIPVIFISALTEQLDKVKAFAIGGVDYLTKPFQMEELHARVETHLKLRRLQIELEEYSRNLELARERLTRDLELARDVQRGFLPLRLPEVPGYEFFAYYESAFEIGGDYYDFIPLPRQRVAVMLGDVAGKGVAAALLMAKLSADARFCMMTEPDPAAAVTKLNSLMNQSGISDQFVTLTAAILDPGSHTVTLVNAGHPSPLIYHRATRAVAEAISNEVTGLPIGVHDGVEYDSCQVSLEPGDCILAFTDGVTEAMDVNNVQLRTKGVYAAVQGQASSPRALVNRVVEVVKQFASGRSQHDDIALVGFGRTG